MIHRFWMGPPREPDYAEALRSLHPQEQLVDWTPETLPRAVRPLCELSEDPRVVSNLVRYALLSLAGGLWFDHDVEPLRRLTDSHVPWTASFVGRREGCALWFPEAGHPMMRKCLDVQRANPDVLGATVLHQVGKRHPDVGHEPGVLPFDAAGRPLGIERPLAIHHWDTARRIHNG